MRALLVILLFQGIAMGHAQEKGPPNPVVERHIQAIINELPVDSPLRTELLQGARGNGVRYPFMDQMKDLGVKRSIVSLRIRFDHKGRPKDIKVRRMQFFSDFGDGTQISDTNRLEAINKAGLEKELGDIAVQRAGRGFWVDVPRPKPRPFIGGANVEFMEEEWLPVPQACMFFAESASSSHQ